MKEAGVSDEIIAKSIEGLLAKSEEKKEEAKEDEKEEKKEESTEDKKEDKKEEKMEKSFLSNEQLDEMIAKSIKSTIETLEKSFGNKLEEVEKGYKNQIETLEKSVKELSNQTPAFRSISGANFLEKSISNSIEKSEGGKAKLSMTAQREILKSVLGTEFEKADGDLKKALAEDIRGYGLNEGASLSKTTIQHLNSINIEVTR